MEKLLSISDAIDRLATRIGKWAAWLILPMVAITMFDVLTRKYVPVQQFIANSPVGHVITSTKLQEMEWHLHTALFALCFGWAYLRDAHVRVDLVREKLKPRKQAWIEFIGCLVFLLPYTAVVTFFGWEFVIRSFVVLEGSASMTGMPYRFVIKGILLAGIMIALLAGLSILFRKLVYLFGPAELLPRTSPLHSAANEPIAALED